MRTRVGRFVLLALLLAAGIGAVLSTWSIAKQIAELARTEQETADRIDHLSTAVAAVSAAQLAYMAPSADRQPERVPSLIEVVRTETSSLRPHVRSLDAGRTLQAIADGAAALGSIEARAQEHLWLGQELMAADLIFSDARKATDAMTSGLRALRLAESAAAAGARDAALKSAWTIIGAVAGVWALGLILLVRLPAARALPESLPDSVVPAFVPRAEAAPRLAEPERPDLSVAAELCTAIARLTSADDLPGLLARAASTLDASGIVVWMAAGEELFAASAFGYQPEVIRHLGPINRAAINATAAAWREGTMQVVAGDDGVQGALVAPMLGPERCVGVLAVELPHGREGNPVTKAVTTMLAAQLAAALAGWPAASAAAPVNVPPLDKAAEA
jgi:hypothetical protein